MKPVLFITSVMPDPHGPGRAKRVHQWLTLLQEEHPVEILLVQDGRKSTGAVAGSEHMRCIQRKTKNKPTIFRNLLFSKSRNAVLHSLFVPGWFSLQAGQRDLLNQWYGHKKYAKILCFRLANAELALYISTITGTPETELDSDDLEAQTWRSISKLLLANGEYRQGVRARMIAWQYYRLEAYYFRHFSQLYLCSQIDKDALLARFPQADIAVLPNKLPLVVAKNKPGADKHLLFVGSLGYYPNEEAVLWFAQRVLPVLRAGDKEWSFHVVGFLPSEKLRVRLEHIDGLFLHSDLPSVGEAYLNTSIVVSPLHAGGGTKLKVIEAMLYNRPVIATGESVRGLELVRDLHFLAAETAEDFLRQIQTLQADRPKYDELVAHAHRFAADRFCYPAADLNPLNA